MFKISMALCGPKTKIFDNPCSEVLLLLIGMGIVTFWHIAISPPPSDIMPMPSYLYLDVLNIFFSEKYNLYP